MSFLEIALAVYLSAFVFLAWFQSRSIKSQRKLIEQLEAQLEIWTSD